MSSVPQRAGGGPVLSRGALALWERLRWWMKKFGEVFPSQRKLASGFKVVERTIRRWLAELVEAGLVSVAKRYRRSNLYSVCELSSPQMSFDFGSASSEDTSPSEVLLVSAEADAKRRSGKLELTTVRTFERTDPVVGPAEVARKAAGMERLSEGDRVFLHQAMKETPLEAIRAGILLGRARRLTHEVNTGTKEKIRSIRYFAGAITEAAKGLPGGYVDHLEKWLARNEKLAC